MPLTSCFVPVLHSLCGSDPLIAFRSLCEDAGRGETDFLNSEDMV